MADDTPRAEKKLCFVIGPIGDAGSPTRKAADWLLKGVIKPVLEGEFGYRVKRADEDARPGQITDQIITDTEKSDIVIADLAEYNPNVYYELGVRHAQGAQITIHMARIGDQLPFDISNYRSIFYSLGSPDELEKAKGDLRDQVTAVLAPDFKPSNPVTHARGFQQLSESKDDRDRIIANIVSRVESLEGSERARSWDESTKNLARALLYANKQEELKAKSEFPIGKLLAELEFNSSHSSSPYIVSCSTKVEPPGKSTQGGFMVTPGGITTTDEEDEE